MKKMKPKKSSESSLSLENSDSLKNFIENQFQCSICKDIFVSPTIINCGHTFCDKCTVRTVNDFLGQTRVRPRCFDQVGNQTTACIVNKYFFTK